MDNEIPSRKFPLGTLTFHGNAFDRLVEDDWRAALLRHSYGDWGDIDDDLEWRLNNEALEAEESVTSLFHDRNGLEFLIVTEGDRKYTSIRLTEWE